MKEQLFTIPLNEAADALDECPFCFIERSIEQDLLDYVLGSASTYMESDMRDITDREGFCRAHFKKMFAYGNTLGNAWILKTHYARVITEMDDVFTRFSPEKTARRKKNTSGANAVAEWVKKKEDSCYICKRYEETFARYLDTFFYLWKKDSAFKEKIINGKGFCLPHLKDLCTAADEKLSEKERKEFYDIILKLTKENFKRISDDVSWLVDKFDYRNHDADWKNSKDALQRGMQKLKGGYPADGSYRLEK